MNIENIMLVRAKNTIPYDGIVRSISESVALRKNPNDSFANMI